MTNEFEKKASSFMAFFIRNKKVAYVVGTLIVLWGSLSALQIPKESAPFIPFGVVNISTPYPGASATDVDTLITQEIESKIKSVNGIDSINSTSSIGYSSISVVFVPDYDMIKGVSDIRSKINEAKSSLPDEIDSDPLIREISSSDQAFTSVILFGEVDSITLTNHAENLKRRLENINGISEVSINGGQERQINVDINPSLLHSYGLTTNDVVGSIRATHTNLPFGDIDIDDLEYTLRFEGRHQNAEDIANVYLRNLTKDDLALVKVGDIAKVYEGGTKKDSIERFTINNGTKSTNNYVELQVKKALNTNIFDMTNKVHEIGDDFAKSQFDENIHIDYVQEIAPLTAESFGVVTNSGITSILIVLALIFIFVGFKEGLIAGLVIPLTFLTTIGILNMQGKTLNFMSNFSMVLALGILVDTAIVIVEGCHDYIRKGNTPYKAAILALNEYKSPLISGTLTTLAVFIPLFVLPGVLGKYLTFIPITVSIVLISALSISLLLITAYASVFLGHKEKIKEDNALQKVSKKLRAIFVAGQKATIKVYGKILKTLIKHRILRIGILYLILISFMLSWLIPVKFELFPSGDAPYISVNIDEATGSTSRSTLKSSILTEKIILEQPEVKLIKTKINGSSASIYIELLSEEDRKEKKLRTSNDLTFDLQEAFNLLGKASIRVQSAAQGPPSESPVAIRIIASDVNNLEKAERVVKDFKDILNEIPNTFGVRDDIENTPGEVKYTINQDKALAYKVNPSEVPGALRTALEGSTAATITRNGIDLDVKVKYDDSFTDSVEKISNVYIQNIEGELIPASEILDYEFVAGLTSIQRTDTNISFTISSLLTEEGNAAEVSEAFFEAIKDYELPDGVRVADAGENEENAALFTAMGSAFVIALMIMLLILVVQFNSFLQPLIILSTIIFAMIGVNVGLSITDTPRSLAFILGSIALAGIVVNDAIILIDQINNKRAEKEASKLAETGSTAMSIEELNETILKAGRSRFTPIILTTLTTTAGIAPLIWVDQFWAGLSYTVIFGLIVASFLTLFVTPAMYIQLDREKMITFGPLLLLGGIGLIMNGINSGQIPMTGIGIAILIITSLAMKRAWKKLKA